METKIGKIKSLNIKHGQNAAGKPWIRYAYEMEDGHKFSHFDKTLGDKFKIGDNVEVTGEKQGQYWTMSDIKEAKADSMVHIDETPQAEKVGEPKMRTSRIAGEIDAKDVMDTARHIYLAESNVDGLKFSEVCDFVTEAFITATKRLEKELRF
tara:strand:+ start:220 stop:678 length:459 start_codon:yes stop_codon:yes gene_type:complete